MTTAVMREQAEALLHPGRMLIDDDCARPERPSVTGLEIVYDIHDSGGRGETLGSVPAAAGSVPSDQSGTAAMTGSGGIDGKANTNTNFAFELGDDGVLLMRCHSDQNSLVWKADPHGRMAGACVGVADRDIKVVIDTGTGANYGANWGVLGWSRAWSSRIVRPGSGPTCSTTCWTTRCQFYPVGSGMGPICRSWDDPEPSAD